MDQVPAKTESWSNRKSEQTSNRQGCWISNWKSPNKISGPDSFIDELYPVAQTVKNLPAMQETRVQSLGRKDPPEKGTPTHSSILAWRIPWTERPGGPQSTGSQRAGHDWVSNATTAIQQLISTSTVFKARVTDSHLKDNPKAMLGSSRESISFLQRSMAVRNLWEKFWHLGTLELKEGLRVGPFGSRGD